MQIMGNRKLDEQKIGRLRSAIVKGGTAKEIAEKFGISVPSVNVYKRKFREEGAAIPSKRGGSLP